MFFRELSLVFNSRQIYEGGFFIMIGKKIYINPNFTKIQQYKLTQKIK